MNSHSTRRVTTSTGSTYALHYASLADLPLLMKEANLPPRKCIVCTDENVAKHYLRPVEASLQSHGWDLRAVVVPAGEASKSQDQLQRIYDDALTWGIDRQTRLVTLGGGVVGDLGGFAAATLLRGLPLIHVPTSLIAQVDSSIGGKTGINHPQGKNLIGAFHPPRFICADIATLQTLPDLEWTSGLAEVVKHACIRDRDFLRWLDEHWDAVLGRDEMVTKELVRRASAIKISVVEEDEHESGMRAILNFGHTFGHAIEQVAGYGSYTHGEAVALGMRAALHLSQELQPNASLDTARKLVRRLPVRRSLEHVSIDKLMEAMASDKKAIGSTLRLILLQREGEAFVTADVAEERIRAAWAHLLDREL